MNDTVIKKFADMGAKAQIREIPSASNDPHVAPRIGPGPVRTNFTIDVRNEQFVLTVPEHIKLEVLDLKKNDRHLVLMTRDGKEKNRFLCGHDERHWFVASVPGGATTVADAKAALQPAVIREKAGKLKKKEQVGRKNEVYIRQGEWFFMPEEGFALGPRDFILKKESLQRNFRSKPHVAEEAVRVGGETRYFLSGGTIRSNRDLIDDVQRRFPSGLREHELERFRKEHPGENLPFTPRIVNPTMYVRGTIRHPDHSTVNLSKVWHRVYMNTEFAAPGMRHVVFID